VKRWLVILSALAMAQGIAAQSVPDLRDSTSAWWTIFEHPGLSSVIEQGLDANPEPNVAIALLNAAQENVRGTAAQRKPEAGITGGIRWGREQSPMTGGVEDEINPLVASARLSWELDVFGRVAASVDAAEARADIRRADLAAIQLALSLELARVFVDLSFRDEQIALLSDSAHQARAILNRAHQRVTSGLDNPVSLDEARVMYQEAEHSLMAAEIEREQQAARLRNLLGGHDPVEEPSPLASYIMPSLPDLTRTNLYLSRPDVVRAYHAKLAAEDSATASSRNRLPALSLVVAAAGQGKTADDPDMWEAWAGPMISYPLWAPRRDARAREAKAGAQAAEATFIAVSLRAVQEVDTAWAARSQAEAMSAHMEARLHARQRLAKTANRKREAGLIQEPERRIARIEQNQAAIAHARWLAAGLQTHIDLVGALGGEL